MKFLELPNIQEDGSVDGVVRFTQEEVQTLMQFAVNFLASLGHTTVVAVGTATPAELND